MKPLALDKLPNSDTPEEITRRCNCALTAGEEEFRAAVALLKAGKKDEAKAAFAKLCEECRGRWIERVGRERLQAAE